MLTARTQFDCQRLPSEPSPNVLCQTDVTCHSRLTSAALRGAAVCRVPAAGPRRPARPGPPRRPRPDPGPTLGAAASGFWRLYTVSYYHDTHSYFIRPLRRAFILASSMRVLSSYECRSIEPDESRNDPNSQSRLQSAPQIHVIIYNKASAMANPIQTQYGKGAPNVQHDREYSTRWVLAY